MVYFKIPSFVRDFFYPSFSVLGTSSGGVSQSEPLHGKFSPNPHESNAELNSINMYLKNFISPLVDIIQINKNFFGKTSTALSTFLPPIRDMYSLYGVYKLIED